MASKSPPIKSLVDKARNTRPQRQNQHALNFIARLPEEQQQLLLELREKYLAGELGISWTPRALLKEIVEPAGIDIGVTLATWRRWVHNNS